MCYSVFQTSVSYSFTTMYTARIGSSGSRRRIWTMCWMYGSLSMGPASFVLVVLILARLRKKIQPNVLGLRPMVLI